MTTFQRKSGSYAFLSTNRTQYYHGPACNIKSLVTGSADTPVRLRGINIFMPVDATDTPETTWDVKSVSPKILPTSNPSDLTPSG